MRKLILPPTINLSTCAHRSQSRCMKLVLLSVPTREENSVVGVFLKSFFILNRCVISWKCILWLRSLCLDAHVHGSCSFTHQKHSVFSVASPSAHLLSHVTLAGKRGVGCGVRAVLPLCLLAFQPRLITPHITPRGAAPATCTGEQRTDLSVFS